MKTVLPPRNLFIFYNIPLERLGKKVSSEAESHLFKMSISKGKYILNV